MSTIAKSSSDIAPLPGEVTGMRSPEGWADYWLGWIDQEAAAAFLGVAPRCLADWRLRGIGPEYSEFSSRSIRYQRLKLREFAEARLHSPAFADKAA